MRGMYRVCVRVCVRGGVHIQQVREKQEFAPENEIICVCCCMRWGDR